MKRLSPDARLGIGALGLLLLLTIFAATRSRAEPLYPPLSTLSSAPDGGRALKLWVEALGYTVKDDLLSEFVPPGGASILFMLEPSFPTEDELAAVDEWVEAGGTLILIGKGYGTFSAVDHYGFSLELQAGDTGAVRVAAPLLLSPPLFSPGAAQADIVLGSERGDHTVLLTSQGLPVLVSFERGRGRVLLGTVTGAFTNAGLKEAGNPELVLNILALAKVKGAVWFDEWHHGLRSGRQILGPSEFLRRTPLGRSLLFAVFAVFIVFLMQGRGFGRPVPLAREIKRRGALEHVTGIANLSRRAAHRSSIMLAYHQQIKRKLGQRYRLDPALDDEEYVAALAGYHPSLDKDGLLNLLKQLKRMNFSEAEMVRLAGDAAKWIDG